MQHFNLNHFNSGSGDGNEDICTRPAYAVRADLDLIFGRDNVSKWADLNNNEDADEIAQRVCWALAEAKDYFDDRLRGGPYSIPFEETYPDQIVSMSARWAGVLLYDSRGVQDSEDENPRHKLSYHRDAVKKFLREVHAGRIRLEGVDLVATDYPKVVI